MANNRVCTRVPLANREIKKEHMIGGVNIYIRNTRDFTFCLLKILVDSIAPQNDFAKHL
jgi:hypothetical protein